MPRRRWRVRAPFPAPFRKYPHFRGVCEMLFIGGDRSRVKKLQQCCDFSGRLFRLRASAKRCEQARGPMSEKGATFPAPNNMAMQNTLRSHVNTRHHSQAVRQRSAKSPSPVRFWMVPPTKTSLTRGFFQLNDTLCGLRNTPFQRCIPWGAIL